MTTPTQPTHAPQFRRLQKLQNIRKPSCAWAFLRAVTIGAMVGGAPYAALTSWLAIEVAEHNDLLSTLTLALAPIIIALPITLVGMGGIVVPATERLHATEAESLSAYCKVGAAGGAFLSLLPVLLFAGGLEFGAILIFVPGGVLAGVAASFVWGRHRMRLKALRAEQDKDPTNPIHDLLF